MRWINRYATIAISHKINSMIYRKSNLCFYFASDGWVHTRSMELKVVPKALKGPLRK